MFIPIKWLIVLFILFLLTWMALVEQNSNVKKWKEKYQEMRNRYYEFHIKVNEEKNSERKTS